MSDPNVSNPAPDRPDSPGSTEGSAAELQENLLGRLNRRRQRVWRRTKRTVRLLVGIPLVIAIALLVLRVSPVVRWVVASRVSALVGAEFQADRAVIELDGRLVVTHPVIVAPGVPGEASKLLSAESASIELDWSGVLSGRVTPLAVRLEKPVLLLSQSTNTSALNVTSVMGARGDSGVGGTTIPPEITFSDGVLRFGEHDEAGTVTVLKDVHGSGSLLPTRAGSPVFAITMTGDARGAQDDSAGRVMVLQGQADLEKGETHLRLRNIALSEWGAESVPSAYRDVWKRLGVKGELTRVELFSNRSEGVSVEIDVADVGMSALVPAGAEIQEGAAPQDLKMFGVNGTLRISRAGLRAELNGRIDGQQGMSRVRLITQGLDVTSPMSCEIRSTRIKVTKDPAFLSYVPKTVREYFEYFSGPTADVDVFATISRPSPVNGQPSPIGVSGTLTFRNGAASFHKFPYPFTDMSGVVRFDESHLYIEQIRGRGPSGATMQAKGAIAPLTDDAKVDVTIDVQRVPIDEHLLKAMPENRRQAAEAVFSRPEYDRLLASNLIRPPNQSGVDGTRSAPPCPFAGEGDITVHVTRELGPAGNWATNVDCRFRELGVIARQFPLPIIGRDVRLRITDTDATIDDGDFVGPRGGRAKVNARVVFFENGERVVKPSLHLDGSGIQIDELLFQAIARLDSGQQPSQSNSGGLSIAALDRVGLAGSIDCTADIRTKAEAAPDAASASPKLDYEFEVDLDGLRALPRLADRPSTLALSEFKGAVHLTPERVWMDNVQARLARTNGQVGPQAPMEGVGPMLPAGSDDAGYVNVSLDAALGDSLEAGKLNATVRVDGLSLVDQVEDIVQVVSPEGAEWIAKQRGERAPEGIVDVVVRAGRSGAGKGQTPDLAVTLGRAHDVEFSALGGRLGVDISEGSMLFRVPSDGAATLRAAGVRSQLSFNAQTAGSVSVDGLVTFDAEHSRISPPTSVHVALNTWRFESPLVLPALGVFGGESAKQRFTEFAPTGLFSADFAAHAEGDQRELAFSGSIRPESLSIERAGRTIAFERVLGALTFNSTPGVGLSGCLDQVVGWTDRWSANVDGSFSAPTTAAGVERDVRVDLGISVDASQADAALIALVPQSARDAMDKLEVSLSGPVSLKHGRLAGSLDNPNVPLEFAGDIEFSHAKLDAGVNVDRMSGVLNVQVSTPGGGLQDRVRLGLHSPRLSVLGIDVRSLDLLASSTENPGEIAITRFTAECHDGRLFGSALLQPAGDSGRKTYRVDAVAAGVAFAPLLQELSSAGVAEPLVGPLPDESRDPDISRGRLDASLTLSGVTGDQRSRVGRGAVRVSRGDVLRLPVIFPLMQLSNLVLPSEETLRGLEAEFHLVGTRAYFPRVVASGKTIALEGAGTLDLPDMNVDFRFNSKNSNPIPVISGVWEALRNELVTTTVTGKLADPKVGSESFSGLRRLFTGAPKPAWGTLTPDELLSAQMAESGRLSRPGHAVPTIAPLTAEAGAPATAEDR